MRFFKTNAGESVLQWSNGMAVVRTGGEEVLDMLVIAESEEMDQHQRAEYEAYVAEVQQRIANLLAKPAPSTLKLT